MISFLKNQILKHQFNPGFIGIFLNPFYIARKGLHKNLAELGKHISGKTLDVGCGTKPYEKLFRHSEYVGLEFDTGIDSEKKQADFYYDGKTFPFKNEEYDSVVTNQVLEHVFTPDDFLDEINRVLKPKGKLLLTVPFVWDEHEQPYDYARYSSFGLKSLLEKHGFKIIEHRKSVNDYRVLSQLLNAYIYKITRGNLFLKNLALIFIMAPVTISGIFLSKILPKNDDLYLDNIVLAEKKISMYNFCTLFDSNYLSRGIACYRSLEKHCYDFHLYIFAFDDKSYSVLNKLNLPKATIISLKQFEDSELLKVKPTRTIAEYCWTSTSSTILYVLENYAVDNCTYIDADIFFYSSPQILFDEMGDKSILITEHRYSPQYNKELKAGKYCVQFVTFKKDERGLKALRWWRDRCIEWCYNRFEDGKFGDQLYLDDWTTRFEGVHVLQHNGGGIAAWNVQQYDFTNEHGQVFGRQPDGKKFEVIFYHFHYLRFYKDDSIELGRRVLSENVLNIFYKPYIQYLDSIKNEISKIDNSFDSNGPGLRPLNWKTPLLFIYRKLRGTYNIFDKQKFSGS